METARFRCWLAARVLGYAATCGGCCGLFDPFCGEDVAAPNIDTEVTPVQRYRQRCPYETLVVRVSSTVHKEDAEGVYTGVSTTTYLMDDATHTPIPRNGGVFRVCTNDHVASVKPRIIRREFDEAGICYSIAYREGGKGPVIVCPLEADLVEREQVVSAV